MPASNMSRVSMARPELCAMATELAREIAQREVGRKLQNGTISRDPTNITKEWKATYEREYYKHLISLVVQDQQPQVIIVENPSAAKYYKKHAIASFSKTNCFVHVHGDCITVSRINFPIDQDSWPDTKEAFLSIWPGPLDRYNETSKRKVADYIDTLWQHDSQRRIRYCNSNNDDQRKTILKLLTELIHRNGSIDASAITRLLLKPEETEIGKEESYSRQEKEESHLRLLETLQKYLLLGKRTEAIKFARRKKLWDHAQCIGFLDKYQPPNTINYIRDAVKLREDSIVKINDEFITTIENDIVKTVYRSLLNRILKTDPESVNIVKYPHVTNNYEFAILSANDCEMEFDQSNETFKLIMAVKQSSLYPVSATKHLIALGYTTIPKEDSLDSFDDTSLRSHVSYPPCETYASKTLTISNIDMLILNEIWEYCSNLARGTCNPKDYDYFINLVPCRLIFASKLLDLGLHKMFAYYLASIKNALLKSHLESVNKDEFYDWDAIERCVENLDGIWQLYIHSPDTSPEEAMSPETLPPVQPSFSSSSLSKPVNQNLGHLHSQPDHMVTNDLHSDLVDASHNDYTSLPYQGEFAYTSLSQNYPLTKPNIPQQLFNQRPIQEEVNDFNPESLPASPTEDKTRNNLYEIQQQQTYNDYSDLPPRKASASQSMDMPLFSPPSFGPPGMTIPEHSSNLKAMTSSSPTNRDPMQSNPPIGDPFISPYSPINEYDDSPRGESIGRRASGPMNENKLSNEQVLASSSGSVNNNTSGPSNNTQPAGDQQNSFLSKLQGLLPKSNSKPMILPDDTKKPIVYDNEKKTWIDTTKQEEGEENDLDDGPPMFLKDTKPPSYSFANKRGAKALYPKSTIQY